MRDAGVRVGEEETFDLCQGTEISPVLAQDPAFCDATGKFSRDRVIEFIQSIPMDQTGNMKTYWDFVENNIVRQQYFTKYEKEFYLHHHHHQVATMNTPYSICSL